MHTEKKPTHSNNDLMSLECYMAIYKKIVKHCETVKQLLFGCKKQN